MSTPKVLPSGSGAANTRDHRLAVGQPVNQPLDGNCQFNVSSIRTLAHPSKYGHHCLMNIENICRIRSADVAQMSAKSGWRAATVSVQDGAGRPLFRLVRKAGSL
jgi:hypothetical protein